MQNVQKLNVWIKTLHTSYVTAQQKHKKARSFVPQSRIKEFYLLLEELQLYHSQFWTLFSDVGGWSATLCHMLSIRSLFFMICVSFVKQCLVLRDTIMSLSVAVVDDVVVGDRCDVRSAQPLLDALVCCAKVWKNQTWSKKTPQKSLFHSVKFRFCVKILMFCQKFIK